MTALAKSIRGEYVYTTGDRKGTYTPLGEDYLSKGRITIAQLEATTLAILQEAVIAKREEDAYEQRQQAEKTIREKQVQEELDWTQRLDRDRALARGDMRKRARSPAQLYGSELQLREVVDPPARRPGEDDEDYLLRVAPWIERRDVARENPDVYVLRVAPWIVRLADETDEAYLQRIAVWFDKRPGETEEDYTQRTAQRSIKRARENNTDYLLRTGYWNRVSDQTKAPPAQKALESRETAERAVETARKEHLVPVFEEIHEMGMEADKQSQMVAQWKHQKGDLEIELAEIQGTLRQKLAPIYPRARAVYDTYVAMKPTFLEEGYAATNEQQAELVADMAALFVDATSSYELLARELKKTREGVNPPEDISLSSEQTATESIKTKPGFNALKTDVEKTRYTPPITGLITGGLVASQAQVDDEIDAQQAAHPMHRAFLENIRSTISTEVGQMQAFATTLDDNWTELTADKQTTTNSILGTGDPDALETRLDNTNADLTTEDGHIAEIRTWLENMRAGTRNEYLEAVDVSPLRSAAGNVGEEGEESAAGTQARGPVDVDFTRLETAIENLQKSMESLLQIGPDEEGGGEKKTLAEMVDGIQSKVDESLGTMEAIRAQAEDLFTSLHGTSTRGTGITTGELLSDILQAVTSMTGAIGPATGGTLTANLNLLQDAISRFVQQSNPKEGELLRAAKKQMEVQEIVRQQEAIVGNFVTRIAELGEAKPIPITVQTAAAGDLDKLELPVLAHVTAVQSNIAAMNAGIRTAAGLRTSTNYDTLTKQLTAGRAVASKVGSKGSADVAGPPASGWFDTGGVVDNLRNVQPNADAKTQIQALETAINIIDTEMRGETDAFATAQAEFGKEIATAAAAITTDARAHLTQITENVSEATKAVEEEFEPAALEKGTELGDALEELEGANRAVVLFTRKLLTPKNMEGADGVLAKLQETLDVFVDAARQAQLEAVVEDAREELNELSEQADAVIAANIQMHESIRAKQNALTVTLENLTEIAVDPELAKLLETFAEVVRKDYTDAMDEVDRAIDADTAKQEEFKTNVESFQTRITDDYNRAASGADVTDLMDTIGEADIAGDTWTKTTGPKHEDLVKLVQEKTPAAGEILAAAVKKFTTGIESEQKAISTSLAERAKTDPKIIQDQKVVQAEKGLAGLLELPALLNPTLNAEEASDLVAKLLKAAQDYANAVIGFTKRSEAEEAKKSLPIEIAKATTEARLLRASLEKIKAVAASGQLPTPLPTSNIESTQAEIETAVELIKSVTSDIKDLFAGLQELEPRLTNVAVAGYNEGIEKSRAPKDDAAALIKNIRDNVDVLQTRHKELQEKMKRFNPAIQFIMQQVTKQAVASHEMNTIITAAKAATENLDDWLSQLKTIRNTLKEDVAKAVFLRSVKPDSSSVAADYITVVAKNINNWTDDLNLRKLKYSKEELIKERGRLEEETNMAKFAAYRAAAIRSESRTSPGPFEDYQQQRLQLNREWMAVTTANIAMLQTRLREISPRLDVPAPEGMHAERDKRKEGVDDAMTSLTELSTDISSIPTANANEQYENLNLDVNTLDGVTLLYVEFAQRRTALEQFQTQIERLGSDVATAATKTKLWELLGLSLDSSIRTELRNLEKTKNDREKLDASYAALMVVYGDNKFEEYIDDVASADDSVERATELINEIPKSGQRRKPTVQKMWDGLQTKLSSASSAVDAIDRAWRKLVDSKLQDAAAIMRSIDAAALVFSTLQDDDHADALRNRIAEQKEELENIKIIPDNEAYLVEILDTLQRLKNDVSEFAKESLKGGAPENRSVAMLKDQVTHMVANTLFGLQEPFQIFVAQKLIQAVDPAHAATQTPMASSGSRGMITGPEVHEIAAEEKTFWVDTFKILDTFSKSAPDLLRLAAAAAFPCVYDSDTSPEVYNAYLGDIITEVQKVIKIVELPVTNKGHRLPACILGWLVTLSMQTGTKLLGQKEAPLAAWPDDTAAVRKQLFDLTQEHIFYLCTTMASSKKIPPTFQPDSGLADLLFIELQALAVLCMGEQEFKTFGTKEGEDPAAVDKQKAQWYTDLQAIKTAGVTQLSYSYRHATRAAENLELWQAVEPFSRAVHTSEEIRTPLNEATAKFLQENIFTSLDIGTRVLKVDTLTYSLGLISSNFFARAIKVRDTLNKLDRKVEEFTIAGFPQSSLELATSDCLVAVCLQTDNISRLDQDGVDFDREGVEIMELLRTLETITRTHVYTETDIPYMLAWMRVDFQQLVSVLMYLIARYVSVSTTGTATRDDADQRKGVFNRIQTVLMETILLTHEEHPPETIYDGGLRSYEPAPPAGPELDFTSPVFTDVKFSLDLGATASTYLRRIVEASKDDPNPGKQYYTAVRCVRLLSEYMTLSWGCKTRDDYFFDALKSQRAYDHFTAILYTLFVAKQSKEHVDVAIKYQTSNPAAAVRTHSLHTVKCIMELTDMVDTLRSRLFAFNNAKPDVTKEILSTQFVETLSTFLAGIGSYYQKVLEKWLGLYVRLITVLTAYYDVSSQTEKKTLNDSLNGSFAEPSYTDWKTKNVIREWTPGPTATFRANIIIFRHVQAELAKQIFTILEDIIVRLFRFPGGDPSEDVAAYTSVMQTFLDDKMDVMRGTSSDLNTYIDNMTSFVQFVSDLWVDLMNITQAGMLYASKQTVLKGENPVLQTELAAVGDLLRSSLRTTDLLDAFIRPLRNYWIDDLVARANIADKTPKYITEVTRNPAAYGFLPPSAIKENIVPVRQTDASLQEWPVGIHSLEQEVDVDATGARDAAVSMDVTAALELDVWTDDSTETYNRLQTDQPAPPVSQPELDLEAVLHFAAWGNSEPSEDTPAGPASTVAQQDTTDVVPMEETTRTHTANPVQEVPNPGLVRRSRTSSRAASTKTKRP
jgi:hypothetical protein